MPPMDAMPTLSLVFVALAAVPMHLFAQDRSIDTPENASPNRYGSGWKFDRGYRKAGDRCVLTDSSTRSGGNVIAGIE